MNASRLFIDNLNAPGKIIINRGGTRSGKTMSIVQLAYYWLCTGNLGNSTEEKGYWSICRKTLPALKATAYRDFLYMCEIGGLWPEHNKADLTFTFGPRCVEFYSLDDESKVRSRKREHLHIVESSEIDFEMFTQLALRTTGKIYLDFNPSDEFHWIRTELEEKRTSILKDVTVIQSTYKDNPFLAAHEIREIEYLEDVDQNLWDIFGQGNYGKITGQIFTNWQIIDEMPEDVKSLYGGIDFGFTADPCAVIHVGIINDRLYLDEVLYERGVNNLRLSEILDKNILYVADAAEPKSINELQRFECQVIPALKGPDSIRSGIQRMQQFQLFVTGRSTNLLKELKVYKHGPDNKPLGHFDHAIDAARYVVQTKLRPAAEVGQMLRISRYGNLVR